MGKTVESITTMLTHDWFMNYKLKWGFGGKPSIIIYTCFKQDMLHLLYSYPFAFSGTLLIQKYNAGSMLFNSNNQHALYYKIINNQKVP